MSDSAIDQLHRELAAEFSYLDVLALALAQCDVEQFTGDSTLWSSVVHDLRTDYPDLLEGIWFTERGYSEQLEDFFRVMARSGVLSFANPRFERIDLAPGAAERITAGAPSSLQDHEDAISEMAARLGELRYKHA